MRFRTATHLKLIGQIAEIPMYRTCLLARNENYIAREPTKGSLLPGGDSLNLLRSKSKSKTQLDEEGLAAR